MTEYMIAEEKTIKESIRLAMLNSEFGCVKILERVLATGNADMETIIKYRNDKKG